MSDYKYSKDKEATRKKMIDRVTQEEYKNNYESTVFMSKDNSKTNVRMERKPGRPVPKQKLSTKDREYEKEHGFTRVGSERNLYGKNK